VSRPHGLRFDPRVREDAIVDEEALASVPFFSALSPAARGAVAPYAEQIDVPGGTQLTGEGAPGYLFFVIESGTAKVLQDEREVGELGGGDFFGEIALLETSERTASVIAKTPMQLVVLSEPAFKRLVETDAAAARECEAAMRERWASPIS
jgi:CRP/FNR family transcriptional regulator, cyclic AMP receptor protein